MLVYFDKLSENSIKFCIQPDHWDTFPENPTEVEGVPIGTRKNKEQTFDVICKLTNLELKQEALFQALIATTFLGQLFHFQRGLKKTSVENKNGFLYKIAAVLQEVFDEKIMLSDATKKALREDVEIQRALQKNFSYLHQKLIKADILPLLRPQKSPLDAKESTEIAPSAPLLAQNDQLSELPVPSAPLLQHSEVKEEDTRIAELLNQEGFDLKCLSNKDQARISEYLQWQQLKEKEKEKERRASQSMRSSPIFRAAPQVSKEGSQVSNEGLMQQFAKMEVPSHVPVESSMSEEDPEPGSRPLVLA